MSIGRGFLGVKVSWRTEHHRQWGYNEVGIQLLFGVGVLVSVGWVGWKTKGHKGSALVHVARMNQTEASVFVHLLFHLATIFWIPSISESSSNNPAVLF